MSRETKDAYRAIEILCQRCHGGMKPCGQNRQGHPRYECDECGTVWVWAPSGWLQRGSAAA